jgi:type VI secretion system protein ImpL
MLLRGMYFSSATQESTAIDRLMGAIAQRFGLQRQRLIAFSGAGRSYFPTEYCAGWCFPRPASSAPIRVSNGGNEWSAGLRMPGAGLILAMACGAWTVSYVENSRAERQL